MPFKKGNPGKPKGAKSARVKAWDELGDSITGIHAQKFNAVVSDLMDSDDPKIQCSGCELYLKAIEYFKPKQSRVTHSGDAEHPVKIIIPKSV